MANLTLHTTFVRTPTFFESYKDFSVFCKTTGIDPALGYIVKRLITLPLALLYLTFTVGLVINNHFCYTTLYKSSLFQQPKNCCTGNESETHCCHNSTSVLRINDSYIGEDFTFDGLPTLCPATFEDANVITSQFPLSDLFYNSSNRPRVKYNKSPLYLTYRVLII
jgi:hypothetical protein